METLDADTQHSFRRDFELAQEAVRSGVTAQRAASADTHWELWSTFCHELALDSLLSNLQDPVALLQVFAHRYGTGTIAPKHKPVRSRTVEDALRSVGQTFAGLGQPDPRLTSTGTIDFRIQRMLSSDTDIIRLVGRWRSDEMLRYLHVQAELRGFSARMLKHGSFVLLPHNDVPCF